MNLLLLPFRLLPSPTKITKSCQEPLYALFLNFRSRYGFKTYIRRAIALRQIKYFSLRCHLKDIVAVFKP
ncbi:hypothetical protein [Nostoc sp.]|uniref:hypothetical protein n=1 Tax=Nostoc sp. TaxID=1180 RepID=UPI002FFA843F